MRRAPALLALALGLALLLPGCSLLGLETKAEVRITKHFTRVILGTRYEDVSYEIENTGGTDIGSAQIRVKVLCEDGMTYNEDDYASEIPAGEKVTGNLMVTTRNSPTKDVTAYVVKSSRFQ